MADQTALDDLLVTAQLGKGHDYSTCPNTIKLNNIKDNITKDQKTVINSLQEITKKIDKLNEETITQRVKIVNIEKQFENLCNENKNFADKFVTYRFIVYMAGVITFFTTLISTAIGYFLKK